MLAARRLALSLARSSLLFLRARGVLCGSIDWTLVAPGLGHKHQGQPTASIHASDARSNEAGVRWVAHFGRLTLLPNRFPSSSSTTAGRFKAKASKQAAIDIMGRTTRASLKGKQAAEEDSTFDYNVSA